MVKLKRKAFRMVGLLFPLTYYLFGDYGFAITITILTLFLAIMFTLEYYRFRYPGLNRWLFRYFRNYIKEKERARISTTTLYLLACWLLLLLFSPPITIAAMIFLVFGDPAAEMVGTRFGRVPLLGKSLEGTAAGFLTCLLAGSLLLLLPGLELNFPLILSGSLAATFMELIPAPVDDNFTIPLFSASVMKLVQIFL